MRIFFLSLFLFFNLRAVTQDTATTKSKLFVPVGCYYSQKSFFNKKPDSEKPFRVVTNYQHKKNGDSTAIGYRIEWLETAGVYSDVREWAPDSNSNKQIHIFCFFDGKEVYVNHGEGLFYKMDGLGKYPYTFARHGFANAHIAGYLLISVTATLVILAADAIAAESMKRPDLYFFNKKQELIKATPEKIAWLLIKDKDLYKEYEKEEKVTTEVMLKYLNKMNERYPDL